MSNLNTAHLNIPQRQTSARTVENVIGLVLAAIALVAFGAFTIVYLTGIAAVL